MVGFRSVFLAAALALGASGLEAQADASPLAAVVGSWEMTTTGRDGPQTFAFALDGQGAVGNTHGSAGHGEAEQGQLKDGTLKFDVVREFNGNSIIQSYTAKLNGNEMKGTVSGSGGGGAGGGSAAARAFTATRKP